MPTAGEPRPTRRNGAPSARLQGTSREYILDRLTRAGRPDLVEAVEAGVVSAFAVAVELGWLKRLNLTGTGSTNQAKRRRFQLDALMSEAWEDEPQRDRPPEEPSSDRTKGPP
jgi:hypothetical protein